MTTLYQNPSIKHQPVGPSPSGEGYTTYKEVDTTVPPKARPILKEITVGGVAIPEAEILAEAQNHPAETPGAAVLEAARALVVRQLLLQEALRTGAATPAAADEGPRETAEDAAIRELIAREVKVPEATEEECRRFYEHNPQRFRTEPIFEARHILIAAPEADEALRKDARDVAGTLIRELTGRPADFGVLARTHSACPSREEGGNLGQITRGSTVAEFERALLEMTPGKLAPQPVESRYGFHVVMLDRRIDGETLPFEVVRPRIAAWLEAAVWSRAVSQYISVLAGRAAIRGIDIGGADSPLVQ
jgi:peptidyl-prolyl cis-trans isomerase C